MVNNVKDVQVVDVLCVIQHLKIHVYLVDAQQLLICFKINVWLLVVIHLILIVIHVIIMEVVLDVKTVIPQMVAENVNK